MTRPASGSSSPAAIRSRVVLPAPLRPDQTDAIARRARGDRRRENSTRAPKLRATPSSRSSTARDGSAGASERRVCATAVGRFGARQIALQRPTRAGMLGATRLGGWDASRATLAALRMDRRRSRRSAGVVRARRRSGSRRRAALAAVPLFLRRGRLAAVRGDLRAARVLPDARGARDPRARAPTRSPRAAPPRARSSSSAAAARRRRGC